MAYFRRPHLLVILEKVLTFISDKLEVFRMVSRYDNGRACITPYNLALSTSLLLDELPERCPMIIILISSAWRQFCCETA